MSDVLQVRFHRPDRHTADNGHGLVPQLLISRSRYKIMARPGERKEVELRAILRNGSPVGWENHCRSLGALPVNEPSLLHEHQVLASDVGIHGWVFRDTIALEEEQKVTDYVHVSLHGLTIHSVLTSDGLICGLNLEW